MSHQHPKHPLAPDPRASGQIKRDARFMKRLGTGTALIAVTVPIVFGTLVPTTALAIGAVATGVAALALNRKMADDNALMKREELDEKEDAESVAASHEHASHI